MKIEHFTPLAEHFEGGKDAEALEQKVIEIETIIADGEREIENLSDKDAERIIAAKREFKHLAPEEAEKLDRINRLLYVDNIG